MQYGPLYIEECRQLLFVLFAHLTFPFKPNTVLYSRATCLTVRNLYVPLSTALKPFEVLTHFSGQQEYIFITLSEVHYSICQPTQRKGNLLVHNTNIAKIT